MVCHDNNMVSSTSSSSSSSSTTTTLSSSRKRVSFDLTKNRDYIDTCQPPRTKEEFDQTWLSTTEYRNIRARNNAVLLMARRSNDSIAFRPGDYRGLERSLDDRRRTNRYRAYDAVANEQRRQRGMMGRTSGGGALSSSSVYDPELLGTVYGAYCLPSLHKAQRLGQLDAQEASIAMRDSWESPDLVDTDTDSWSSSSSIDYSSSINDEDDSNHKTAYSPGIPLTRKRIMCEDDECISDLTVTTLASSTMSPPSSSSCFPFPLLSSRNNDDTTGNHQQQHKRTNYHHHHHPVSRPTVQRNGFTKFLDLLLGTAHRRPVLVH